PYSLFPQAFSPGHTKSYHWGNHSAERIVMVIKRSSIGNFYKDFIGGLPSWASREPKIALQGILWLWHEYLPSVCQ
ncbi:MAG TPA: hypothetical protein VK589_14210, partial [Chryseolinea sp.]|nr:hypothetical protein [Chryseolinea sp.]